MHVGEVGHQLHPCTKYEVRQSPFGRYGTFPISALICLSTIKWGHGSPVQLQHPANSQLSNLVSLSILDLGSAMGQTDGRQPSTLYVPLYGGGHNKYFYSSSS